MIVKRLPRLLLLGLILSLVGLPGLALAVQSATLHTAFLLSATLNPSADNTLYEDATGSLSNGAGAYFFAGRAGVTASGAIRRGLIRFDLASSVPASATIVSATLYLTMSQTVAGPQPVELHRVTASWGEGNSNATTMGGGMGAPAAPGDATWLHRFYSTTLWTKAGGDFVITASAAITVDNLGAYAWSAPGMVTDVQGWLYNPAANDGWLLLGNEATSSTTKRFNSRENTALDTRPVLLITYTLPYQVYLPIVLR